MKRIAILLLLAMTLSLTACISDSSGNEETGTRKPAVTTAEPSTTQVSTTEEKEPSSEVPNEKESGYTKRY